MTVHFKYIYRTIYPIMIGLLLLWAACVERGDNAYGNQTLKVLGTTPADGELHVDPEAVIAVRFDRALDLRTVDQDSLRVFGPDGNPLSGWAEFNLEDGWLHFHPAQPLEEGYTYRGRLSQKILDFQGFGIRGSAEWRWVTEGNEFPLTLTGLSPAPKSEDIPPDTDIQLQFDQPLDRNSLYGAFEVNADSEDWDFRVDTDPSRPNWVRLVPGQPFEPGAHVIVHGRDILNAYGKRIESIEFDFRIE